MSTRFTMGLVPFALAAPLILLGCGGASHSAPPPAKACLNESNTMKGGGSSAMPPHCASACLQDSDCTTVSTSCPGCCEWHAISVSYEVNYSKTKTNDCRSYSGLVCGCGESPPAVKCVANVCTL